MDKSQSTKSTKNSNFTLIDNSILDNTDLTIYEKLTYVILSRYSNSNNQCFPSIKTLSQKVGCSIRKMGQVVKSLVAKGLIIIQNRHRTDGGKTSNLYTLIKRTISTQMTKLRACIKQPSNCTSKGTKHDYRAYSKPSTYNNYNKKQSGFINFEQRTDWDFDEIERQEQKYLERYLKGEVK